MKLRGVAAALVAAGMALGQAQPAFEVASVKRSVAPRERGKTGSAVLGGDARNIRWLNTRLTSVLTQAYGVKIYQIERPSWMDTEEYDILATAPEGSTREQIPAMLRNLLAERFRMVARRETRERPVYALVVGKDGPKLKKSEGGGKGSISFTMGGPETTLTARTVRDLANMLSGFLDRPVLDKTGIEGQYDIRLTVAAEDLAGMQTMLRTSGASAAGGTPAPESAPAPSIFTAIQELGLKLDPAKAPVEFIVVEKAEKNPTAN